MSTENPTPFWTLPRLTLAAIVTVPLLVFSYRSIVRKDYAALLDQQVDQAWMIERTSVDAQEFFANGGVYENRHYDDGIDQEIIVPLVNQLRDNYGLNVVVLVDDDNPKQAFALLAEVPDQRELRNEIRKAILDINGVFPGLIFQNWGHRWLTLDVFDAEEVEPLARAGTLRRLQAAQRRMD